MADEASPPQAHAPAPSPAPSHHDTSAPSPAPAGHEQPGETAPGAGATSLPAHVPGPSLDEGQAAAHKAFSEIQEKIEVKAMTVRQYLEATVVPLLLQGLQNLVLERPTNPVEYLAAFLLKSNTQNPAPPHEVKKECQSKEAESASSAPDAKIATGHVEVKDSNSAPSEASHSAAAPSEVSHSSPAPSAASHSPPTPSEASHSPPT